MGHRGTNINFPLVCKCNLLTERAVTSAIIVSEMLNISWVRVHHAFSLTAINLLLS